MKTPSLLQSCAALLTGQFPSARRARRSYQERWLGVPGQLAVLEDRTLLSSTFNNNTALPIPDTNTFVFSSINVAGFGFNERIGQVEVRIDISHVVDADLDIFLVAPGGAEIELSTDNGGGNDHYTNTVFTTATAASITTGAAPFTGTFRPEGIADYLNLLGTQPNGNWQLKIRDDVAVAVGTLNNWSITITSAPNLTGFAAGNTFYLFAPPTYDRSHIDFDFTAAGLDVSTRLGTTLNGLENTLLPGVNSLIAFFGSGDEFLDFDATLAAPNQQTLLLFLGSGRNNVFATDLDVTGLTLLTSTEEINLTANQSTFGGLTVIGGTGEDDVTLTQSTVNGAAILLLGADFNDVSFTQSTVTGLTLVESSQGPLTFVSTTTSLSSLLLVGGTTGGDLVTFTGPGSTVGTATLLLGGGGNNFIATGTSFGSFLLISSSVVVLQIENPAPNGSSVTFNGAATFFVGGGSTLNFGRNPLPSDPTNFNGPLTIISSTPNSTLRRRNTGGVGNTNPLLINIFEV